MLKFTEVKQNNRLNRKYTIQLIKAKWCIFKYIISLTSVDLDHLTDNFAIKFFNVSERCIRILLIL
jgi:hypothetical protein